MIDAPDQIHTRFGSFSARADSVVMLPEGLPGFERCRRYVVVSAPSLEPFSWLQGVDVPAPSFLALDPGIVLPSFRKILAPADRRRLEVAGDEPLLWLALVRLHGDQASVNLRAPVVINPARMLGLQTIAADTAYAIDHPLGLD